MLVHFQTHAVVNLIVRERDVVLVDRVPFLELDLRVIRAGLGTDELLQVADGVVWTALHTNFTAETVISNHFNQSHDSKALDESEDDGTGSEYAESKEEMGRRLSILHIFPRKESTDIRRPGLKRS